MHNSLSVHPYQALAWRWVVLSVLFVVLEKLQILTKDGCCKSVAHIVSTHTRNRGNGKVGTAEAVSKACLDWGFCLGGSECRKMGVNGHLRISLDCSHVHEFTVRPAHGRKKHGHCRLETTVDIAYSPDAAMDTPGPKTLNWAKCK